MTKPHFLTAAHYARLLANGQIAHAKGEQDFYPVVKLFTPDAGFTWLLTEIDPEEPDIAFGLCDLGMGFPELGSVSLTELAALRGKIGLPIERARWFEAARPLSAYMAAAKAAGRIMA